MPTKISYLYSAKTGGLYCGWSENFWFDANPIVSLGHALILVPDLMPLHAVETTLTHIRATPTDPALPTVLEAMVPPVRGSGGNATITTDFIMTALLLRMTNQTIGIQTRQWIRGIPDNAVQAGAIDPVYLTQKFNPFKTALLISPISLYNQQLAGVRYAITTVDVSTGSMLVPNHPFHAFDRVRIARGQGITKLNSTYTVASVTANTVTLASWNPPEHWGTYIPGTATMQLLTKELSIITDANAARITKHDTGRPFALLHGRRRARRRIPAM
jgi:hypothetical protein